MTTSTPTSALQLRSIIKASGELELSLVEVQVPKPKENEVVVRIGAAPLNPSDIGLLFGAADITKATYGGTKERPVVTAPVPEAARKAMAGRVDQSLPVGNEGAGVVVEAGSSAAAQALLGKTVAALAGEMYAEYRVIAADQALVMPGGVTAVDASSSFVNPLTALGMIETMKSEKHTALVHTAAASSLGQMLQKLCTHDEIPLVNIVRKPEQAAILRAIGATYICDSSAPTFEADLVEAIDKTGATLAFDATGGGTLASQILSAMEVVQSRKLTVYSRYGSTVHKQVYLYGSLDMRPTELRRSYGMSWGIGGWIVFGEWAKLGAAAEKAARARVASEIKTTFATTYSKEVSLTEMLSEEAITAYSRRATGEKYLVVPSRG